MVTWEESKSAYQGMCRQIAGRWIKPNNYAQIFDSWYPLYVHINAWNFENPSSNGNYNGVIHGSTDSDETGFR